MSLAEDIGRALKLVQFDRDARPRYAEASKRGGWALMSTTALAALVVRPAGTTGVEIWNNSVGKVMVVDRIFAHELVTSTTGLGGGSSQWAMVSAPVAPPTDAAFAISSLSGLAAASKTVLSAVSQAVADNGWFPVGNTVKKESAGAVVPGGSLEALIEGRLRVPYGCALCLHVVSGYVADTFTQGAAWYWENE